VHVALVALVGEVSLIIERDSRKTARGQRAGRIALCVQGAELPYQYASAEGPITAIEDTRGRCAARYRWCGLRLWLPGISGSTSREVPFVAGDFGVDEVETVLQLLELPGDAELVRAEQLEPFRLVAAALADELRQAADRRQRHAGGPELHAIGQPLDVLRAVDAPAALITPHLAFQQPFALIQPQGVHAQPGAPGYLTDTQTHVAHHVIVIG
jgi:hypothetical protein